MYIKELNGLYVLTINDPAHTPVVFYLNDNAYVMIRGVVITYAMFSRLLIRYIYTTEQTDANNAIISIDPSVYYYDDKLATREYDILYEDGKCNISGITLKETFKETFKNFILAHSSNKELKDAVTMMEKSLTDDRSMRLFVPVI